MDLICKTRTFWLPHIRPKGSSSPRAGRSSKLPSAETPPIPTPASSTRLAGARGAAPGWGVGGAAPALQPLRRPTRGERLRRIPTGSLWNETSNPPVGTGSRRSERVGATSGRSPVPARSRPPPSQGGPGRWQYLARREPQAGCGRRILRRSPQSRGRAASHAAPRPSRMVPAGAQFEGFPAPLRASRLIASGPAAPPRGGANRKSGLDRAQAPAPAEPRATVPPRDPPACPLQASAGKSAFWVPVDFLWAEPPGRGPRSLPCSALQFTEQTLSCYFIYSLPNPLRKVDLYCQPCFSGEGRDRAVNVLVPGHTAAPGQRQALSPRRAALGGAISFLHLQCDSWEEAKERAELGITFSGRHGGQAVAPGAPSGPFQVPGPCNLEGTGPLDFAPQESG